MENPTNIGLKILLPWPIIYHEIEEDSIKVRNFFRKDQRISWKSQKQLIIQSDP